MRAQRIDELEDSVGQSSKIFRDTSSARGYSTGTYNLNVRFMCVSKSRIDRSRELRICERAGCTSNVCRMHSVVKFVICGIGPLTELKEKTEKWNCEKSCMGYLRRSDFNQLYQNASALCCSQWQTFSCLETISTKADFTVALAVHNSEGYIDSCIKSSSPNN